MTNITDKDVTASAILLDDLGGALQFEKIGISFAKINTAFCEAFARHREEARAEGMREAAALADRNAKWHEEAFRKEVILKNADKQTHFAARFREAEELATAILNAIEGKE